MKRLLKFLVVVGVLGGAGYAASAWGKHYLAERSKPRFKTVKVEQGDIESVVNSTGTVKPVKSVSIGAFVSGPIANLFVDFNDPVKQGQVLARIDTRLYDAAVKRDEASLAVAQAEVTRVEALLQQARNDERRSISLRESNKDFISDSEMDQYRFARQSLEAQLAVAQAAVKQASAGLENSKANLDYADITSPVDGIVIDRKVDPGQTMAAAFQTPEMFIVAPEMEKEMHVFATVDEADIGYIIDAKTRQQPVKFTVDAYPEEIFTGMIHQVRMSSTTTQNVVTYPVVVSAPNAELKLMPGMTANLSFQVERKEDIVKIPNAALRYYPKPEHVRDADRKLLELSENPDEAKQDDTESVRPSADEKVEAARRRRRRHVWVKDPGVDLLRAVAVVTGLSDSRFSELLDGELAPGAELVSALDTTPGAPPK